MSPRFRLAVPALLAIAVVVAGVLLSGGALTRPTGSPGAGSHGPSGGPDGSGALEPTVPPSPTPRPEVGGTELYGYLPYWQVTETMAAHLDSVPLTTLALFSVSSRRTGEIDTRDSGYKRMTSELGRRIIRGAHARGKRVEIVFTSFGGDRNGVFFGRLPVRGQSGAPTPTAASSPARPTASPTASPAPGPSATASTAAPPWRRAVRDLVDLVVELGVDGVNVDVELLDELDRDAYGEFLTALRAALVAVVPDARVSVATEAGPRGVGNAIEAASAGVDRLFLMGYDYHWSGSQPGASSPVDRSDGLHTLRWSIEQYVAGGVPRDRILLGLPLYGMSWKTTGPDRTAPVLGKGATWIPNRHLEVLLASDFAPARDPLEIVEFFIRPEGDAWRVTYYDSPATLRAKLALARDQGLAGGGFWAIGYERGLPGYRDLMRDFRNGRVGREEAPPPPY